MSLHDELPDDEGLSGDDPVHAVIDALLAKARIRTSFDDWTPEEWDAYNHDALERLARHKAQDEAWLASLTAEERQAELDRREAQFERCRQETDLMTLEDEMYAHLDQIPDGLDLTIEMSRRPHR